MSIKRPFLGRGLSYPLRVGPDGDFARNNDTEESVRDAITFLIHTLTGERVFRPSTGSRLPLLKHEPNSEDTQTLLRQEIQSSLIQGEPRIEDVDVRVESGFSDPRAVLVKVSYTIIGANVSQNLVFPFFLGS